MYKILIASDRSASRDHLRSVCKARGFHICGEASRLEQALILSELHLPDIVIFNFRCAIPKQTFIVAQIAKLGTSVKVLIYSALGPSRATQAYIRAGASGFVAEQGTNDQLMSILQGMIAGFTMVPVKALKQSKIKLAHRSSRTYAERRPIKVPPSPSEHASTPTSAALVPGCLTGCCDHH
ncbi:DNA-binding NarL/FixJ family response regulator [Pseudomonas sp. TE3786]